MKTLLLYLIGLCMGIADLIPGISGGTIAFLAGIYEDLLSSIKTINIQSLKKINWRFLLPLGSGIATSFLALASLFHYLLSNHKQSTYGFFFGVIAASVLIFLKQVKIRKLSGFILVAIGFAAVVLLGSFSSSNMTDFSFLFLLMSGILASSAMLLPGISGSYVLVLLGVYPVAIQAIATRSNLMTLFPLLIGIILGLVFFSRVVSFFLNRFKEVTLALLTGLMIGGLKQIYPFSQKPIFFPILFAFIGFAIVFAMDALLARKLIERRFKE